MINLYNLKEANPQQIFDQVISHLSVQQKRCIDIKVFNQPRYHFKDLKSAAGCLITKEQYKLKMEGSGWSDLVERELVPPNYWTLIEDIEEMHDYYDICDWPAVLEQISQKYKLHFEKLLFCQSLGFSSIFGNNSMIELAEHNW